MAHDTGNWSSSTFEELQIRLNGFTGYWTTSAVGFAKKIHHPQHIVRLPNKDGHAYFAITQSNRFYHEFFPAEYVSDGMWMVVKIDKAAYDPFNDRVIDTPGSDGEYVFEEHFNDNRDAADDEYFDQRVEKGSQFVISRVTLVQISPVTAWG